MRAEFGLDLLQSLAGIVVRVLALVDNLLLLFQAAFAARR